MPTATLEREVPSVSEIEWRLARVKASREPVEAGSIRAADNSTTDAVSPAWNRLVAADIKHLSSILGQLLELRSGAEQDEYGVLRPTDHAFSRVFSLLVDTAIVTAQRGSSVPYGCASTDSQGGVRIEWFGAKCSVHLVIPASPQEKSYIYHEIGDDYGTTEAVTAESLGDWLRAFESKGQG